MSIICVSGLKVFIGGPALVGLNSSIYIETDQQPRRATSHTQPPPTTHQPPATRPHTSHQPAQPAQPSLAQPAQPSLAQPPSPAQPASPATLSPAPFPRVPGGGVFLARAYIEGKGKKTISCDPNPGHMGNLGNNRHNLHVIFVGFNRKK